MDELTATVTFHYTVQRRVSEIERTGSIVRKQSRKCAVSKRESLIIELATSAAWIADTTKPKRSGKTVLGFTKSTEKLYQW